MPRTGRAGRSARPLVSKLQMTHRGAPRLLGSLAFLVAALAARDARACSCILSGPPCQAYFQVDAVFAATVRAITPSAGDVPLLRNVRVDFDRVTAYRGPQGPSL